MIGRLFVLLVAANLAWAAWWYIGLNPRLQTDPERLQRQVRPDVLQIRPLPDGADDGEAEAAAAATPTPASAPDSAAAPAASTAASAPAVAPVPGFQLPAPAAPASVASVSASVAEQAAAPKGVCLQAGIFDDKQIDAVRRAAAALPAGSWRVDQVALPSRWMVYIGKLAGADAVRAKRAELHQLGVDADRPGAALEPGLSLGRFSSQDAAQRALADLGHKGVKTARVVQERRDTPAYMLRLPAADDALRQQASGSLRGALGGKEWRECE